MVLQEEKLGSKKISPPTEEEKSFPIRNVKNPSFAQTSRKLKKPSYKNPRKSENAQTPKKYTKQEIHGYNGVEIEFSPPSNYVLHCAVSGLFPGIPRILPDSFGFHLNTPLLSILHRVCDPF